MSPRVSQSKQYFKSSAVSINYCNYFYNRKRVLDYFGGFKVVNASKLNNMSIYKKTMRLKNFVKTFIFKRQDKKENLTPRERKSRE